jgi:hypothetical protein
MFRPSNDEAIEPISPEKKGMWYFGEPIEIDFRWANGDTQADKPIYDQNDPDLILIENTAKIQCVGNWSVLRFLQKYRAESVNAKQLAPNQVLLCFKIPLHTGKIAKIYVGITPSEPAKPGDPTTISLKVPITPGKMPELPASVESVVSEAVLTNKIHSETDTGAPNTPASHDKQFDDKAKETDKENKNEESITNTTTKIDDENPKKTEKPTQAKAVKKLLESSEVPELTDTTPVIEVTEEAIE